MKFNIVGFNQERLVELGLDGTDALLLRWFIDFYASTDMQKYEHGGKHYGWVAYSHVVKDLPVLGIRTKDGVYRRFKKFVHKKILVHYNHQVGSNSLSCYGPDVKLDYLRWDQNNEQGRMKNRGGYRQGRISVRGGSDEKPYYPSTINPSTKKNSPKKESAPGKNRTRVTCSKATRATGADPTPPTPPSRPGALRPTVEALLPSAWPKRTPSKGQLLSLSKRRKAVGSSAFEGFIRWYVETKGEDVWRRYDWGLLAKASIYEQYVEDKERPRPATPMDRLRRTGDRSHYEPFFQELRERRRKAG